jgi:very-short-patch-repair endonuclease
MALVLKVPHVDDLLSRYVAGESENKLAREVGIDRGAFRRRMLAAGITPRNQSEAETLKWAGMIGPERAAQVAAAQIARRGQRDTIATKETRAKSNERTLIRATPVELALVDRLRHNGLHITPQKAIGVYNIDVALESPRIAVEIFGGNFHASGSHAAAFHERVKYLLNCGWSVVIVWVDARRYPLSIACDDYIIALAQSLGGNPPTRGQYRVILGNGDAAPIRKNYFNTPADIERLTGGN